MSKKISPFVPKEFPDLPHIPGLRLTGKACGLKKSGKPDMMLAVMEPGTIMAGVFTKSLCAAAPVEWCREALQHRSARAILVNSGNANAFTGAHGRKIVKNSVVATADIVGCAKHEVFIASTGVIGEKMPLEKIAHAVPQLYETLETQAWYEAALAIRTTDAYPKAATAQCEIAGKTITINGIAKGAGMIAPDMATMLAFIFTDANISAETLQSSLEIAVDKSFHAITVDGDTSTNDTVLCAATCQADHTQITRLDDPELQGFQEALDQVALSLAHQIVQDGEGAQKFLSIVIKGATSPQSARKIGLAVANSPLVKTALAGEDPNWGRIVMAVGKSGEPVDRDTLQISIGPWLVAHQGEVAADHEEKTVANYMKQDKLEITIDIGLGQGFSQVWTCDMGHSYININSDYRS